MNSKRKVSQARGKATRSTIIRAAAELFAEKGYKGASVREIMAKANTSMGSFYHHFKDKADLYLQIADEGNLAVRHFLRLVGNFDSDKPLEERSLEFFEAYIDTIDKYNSMVLLLISEKGSLPTDIKKMVGDELNVYLKNLEEGLTMAIKAGIVEPMNVRLASEAVLGMILNLVKVYIKSPGIDRSAIIKTLAFSTVGILKEMPKAQF